MLSIAFSFSVPSFPANDIFVPNSLPPPPRVSHPRFFHDFSVVLLLFSFTVLDRFLNI